MREKLFEKFEDIKISVGTIYKILKDNDFQWIAPSIIPKWSRTTEIKNKLVLTSQR